VKDDRKTKMSRNRRMIREDDGEEKKKAVTTKEKMNKRVRSE
jgi:hypothetical protein